MSPTDRCARPALSALIDTDHLARQLGDPALRVFDATVHLRRKVEGGSYTVESGRETYAQGHIPTAEFADLVGAFSNPDAKFPLIVPSAGQFAREAGKIGIGAGVHVVVYAQGSPMWATRFWWLLRYFGFDAVSVLDGGLTAWVAEGGPIESGAHHYRPERFVAAARPRLMVDREHVRAVVEGHVEAPLVNALSPSTFGGVQPGAYSRPGRIPGSVNLPASSLLTDDLRFVDLDEMQTRLDTIGLPVDEGRMPIVYCGSGIAATVDLFALALLGRNGRLYDGSLTEWSADPSLPLETG
jgi:thiosulfate/3-mercaptopyruvate sulfurtransferase